MAARFVDSRNKFLKFIHFGNAEGRTRTRGFNEHGVTKGGYTFKRFLALMSPLAIGHHLIRPNLQPSRLKCNLHKVLIHTYG